MNLEIFHEKRDNALALIPNQNKRFG